MLHHVLSALLSLFSFHTHPYTDSILPLQMLTPNGESTICTAWSLNEESRLYGTAAHCVIAGILSDPATTQIQVILRDVDLCGLPATVVFLDPFEDLAVVQGACAAPALQLGTNPAVGFQPTNPPPVHVYGYLWGASEPTYFSGRIGNLNAGGYMIFDLRVGPGHSGSPVLDAEDHVISVMQIGELGFSGGATYAAMQELVPYWGQ